MRGQMTMHRSASRLIFFHVFVFSFSCFFFVVGVGEHAYVSLAPHQHFILNLFKGPPGTTTNSMSTSQGIPPQSTSRC